MAENRIVVGISDFDEVAIRGILTRAEAFRHGASAILDRPPLLGLLFLEASLRTRVGFAAAAARLGGQTIDVIERRSSEIAMPEGWLETLRVLSGAVDLIVTRPGRPLSPRDQLPALVSGLLNAGDTGPAAEHPSQALIDLYAIEGLRGPVDDLTVAMCGDLRMRAARSLLRLFKLFPPMRLVQVSDRRLQDPATAGTIEEREPWQLQDVDVLYVVGIPHGALDEPGRARLRVGRSAMASLPQDSVVLSPMPVIDEIAAGSRTDPRVQMLRQSDDGLYVRMALIEALLI